jgi:hypothetical protein
MHFTFLSLRLKIWPAKTASNFTSIGKLLELMKDITELRVQQPIASREG